MPTFRYVAKNWAGESREGECSAVNLGEAIEQLRSQELFVINIKEQSTLLQLSSPLAGLNIKLSEKKPKSRDFMVFCRQFATMLQAGIPVLQILKILAQQSENEALREKLREITVDVERGSDLAGAMKKHGDFFPRIIVSMVETGEAGGILDTIMERLADHFQRQHDLEAKIRSATIYPAVVTVLAVLVLLLMIFFVLPRFAEMLDPMGVEMPLITRVIMALADLFIRFWYLALGLLALLAFLLGRYLKTERGRAAFDRLRLNLPIFGPLYTKMITARFTRTLATLLASGVALLSALELVEKVIDNRVLSGVLAETAQAIRRGQNIFVPLAESAIFPPMMVEMVHVGEESGTLDEMLSRSADFYEAEVTYFLDRLAAIIEPVLLIAVGFIVALLLISIMTPMLKMYEAF
ncbi:MAG TPA: type II secretion system F family protein [Bacillota bacterium]|nr:type II secretion system F family protein [Bacillota bacterium]